MADNRLQWRQIAAPDLRGTSAILANANQAFNSAFENANNVLAQYRTGQEEKADNELLTEIASIDSEDKLASFLNSGALEGRNISQGMRDRVFNLRDTVLGYGQSRANIEGTRASTAGQRARTAIAQAVEGRNAAKYADSIASRDALRGVAGIASTAAATGRQYGRGDPGADTRLMLARTLQAEAGNQGYEGMLDVGSVIRNRAASGKFGDGSIEGVIMQPGQFSAWNSVTGYAGGEQGQNMSFQPSKQAMDAADAILRGDYQDRTGGALNYYAVIPAVSGVPSWSNDSFRKIDGDHFFGSASGQTFKGNTGAYRGYGGGSATDQIAAVRQQLVDSGQFTPAQIEAQLAPLIKAQNVGQARIDDLAKQDASNQVAAAILSAGRDPDNLSTQAVGQDVLSAVSNLTPNQQLAALDRSNKAAEAVLQATTPSIAEDPAIAGAVSGYNQDTSTAIKATLQERLLNEVPAFVENPAGTLLNQLGISSEAIDKNDVRNQINSLAQATGVTPEVAAVALRETYQSDPSGVNTWANVLSSERAAEYIRANMSQQALGRHRERRDYGTRQRKRLENLETQLNQLRTRQARGNNSPELNQEIARVQSQILSFAQDNPITDRRSGADFIADVVKKGEVLTSANRLAKALQVEGATTPELREVVRQEATQYLQSTGYLSRLQDTPQGSPERVALERQIVRHINADASLSNREKAILLAPFIAQDN
jgi:spore germination cell wall hydrolase CwlJ-like protein